MNESTQPIALVTGANRGIGLEVTRQLLARGYTVLMGVRDRRHGESVARELSGDVHVVTLDVSDPQSIRAAADDVRARFRGIDALVNNAAIGYDPDKRALDVNLDDVRTTHATNLFGAWAVVQAFVPLVRASAHGRIVNVTSEAGSLASMGAGTPAYATSKVALNALTRILAAELRDDAILVNAICPGWTATEMGGPGGRPVSEGAASIVWGVTLPDDGPTGGFFRDGKPLPW